MEKKVLKLSVMLFIVALVLSLTSLSSLAATSYTAIGGSTTFTKNLVVDEDANIPDVTFTFTVSAGTPVAASTSNLEILASATNATVGTAVFSSADTAGATAGLPTDADPLNPTAGKKYASKTVTVTFPSGSFTKPGCYRYVIAEVDGNVDGITYDTSSRYLDVFVVADNNDVLSIDSCTLRTSATNIALSGAYASDPGVKSEGYTNSVAQYDFTFTKAITGNQGDKNKRFTFTLEISNAIPGTYVVDATDVTGNPASITVDNNGDYTGTFALTNGSSLTVVGLNEDAVVDVSEAEEDYSPSYSINGAAAVDGNDAGDITLDDDYTVDFTNERDGIIPTGVIMAVAPYVIGLCLFGAILLFAISKKRKANSYN